jgi:hypothetical protein
VLVSLQVEGMTTNPNLVGDEGDSEDVAKACVLVPYHRDRPAHELDEL